MNEFRDVRLAQRLLTLESRVDATALVTRVLGDERSRPRALRRPRVARIAAVAVLLVIIGTGGASYYAPVFAQAMADAPIAGGLTGWMLRSAGLAGAPHRVTTMGETSSSVGYRVELVGGYADAGRTILFVRSSPAARVALPSGVGREFVLADQFGQTYRITSAVQNSLTGESTFIFEPIRWPASAVGARLRLSFNTIEEGVASNARAVTGRWELAATLAMDEGRILTTPAGGAIGPLSVSFSRVVSTTSAVLVDLEVTPGSLELYRVIPDGQKGRAAFTVKLFDDAGREQVSLQSTGSSAGSSTQRGQWIWLHDNPGRYELRIAYEGVGSLTREIDVP
jgi:hypothetical protein